MNDYSLKDLNIGLSHSFDVKITEEMNFQVWGVVTFIIHKANASASRL